MTIHRDPVLGHWYLDDQDRYMQVTGVSGRQGRVEVRYRNGDMKEFSLEEWDDFSLRTADEPPEEEEDETQVSDLAYRRATGWGERSPDDFPERG